MKRMTQLILLAFISLICTSTWAETYTLPIPVGSSDKQVQSYGGTYPYDNSRRTEAQTIRFFDHPKNTSSATPKNFDNPQITITGTSTPVDVMDIMGSPGLRPQPPIYAPNYRDMLDVMLPEIYVFPTGDENPFAHEGEGYPADTSVETVATTPMDPAHGFCPPKTFLYTQPYTDASGNSGTRSYYLLLECDVTKKPFFVPSDINSRTDRQLELADIKNFTDYAEWSSLLDWAPLEQWILGSDQAISPYDARTYTATIMSTGYMTNPGGFVWQWVDPDTGLSENMADPYTQIFSYGFTQLGNFAPVGHGKLTAAYDPVYLHKNLRAVAIEKTSTTDSAGTVTVNEKAWDWYDIDHIASYPPETADSIMLIYSSLMRYMPIISYRPDGERYKLTGYTALPVLPENFDPTDWAATAREYFWDIALRANINPIDMDTLSSGANTYVSVLNQATLGSIDQCYRDSNGLCFTFSDSKKHPWRHMVGSYINDQKIKPLSEDIFPHKNVSWLTIWQEKYKWMHDTTYTDHENPNHNPTDNINEFLEPKYFALVGPGAFFATTVRDFDKDYLVVASGEETNKGFFIYKINPEPNDSEVLFFDANPDPASTNKIAKLPGIIPEAFRVHPPGYTPPGAGENLEIKPGFAPYEIHAGNFDNNLECEDLAITWRGKRESPLKPAGAPVDWKFKNKYGENVIFDFGAAKDHRVFSNVVTILIGVQKAGRCVYESTIGDSDYKKDIVFPMPAAIAALAVHDFDGDTIDDLVIGDLNPKEFESDPSGNKHYTAFAYLLKKPFGRTAADATPIRMGYYATVHGPAVADKGEYLRSAAMGKKQSGEYMGMTIPYYYIPGVGALDVDRKHNIASVNGFPVMLPTFMGCMSYGYAYNTYLDSIPELLLSIGYNSRLPHVAIDIDGVREIAPMRCSLQSKELTGALSADTKEMIADLSYDSKSPYIASINELVPAQATNAPAAADILTAEQWKKLEGLLKFMKIDENRVQKMMGDLKAYLTGEPQSLEGALIKALLPAVLMQFETTGPNVKPAATVNVTSAFLEKLDFIKDAWAGTLPLLSRLARGQARPPLSRSEMTVVVVKPPELTGFTPGLGPFIPGFGPRCGDTSYDPATEECGDPGAPDCPADKECIDCHCKPLCGNHTPDPGEECEPGVTLCMDVTETCDPLTCQCRPRFEIERPPYGTIITPEIPTIIGCGDRVFDAAREQCEPSTTPPVACPIGVCDSATCLCSSPPHITCGDTVFDPATEDCDISAGVTCTSRGMLEPCTSCHCASIVVPICGDGRVNTPAEYCDGSDLSRCPPGSTGCDPSCHCLGCGDGAVTGTEQCEAGDLTRCPVGTTHCDASCMCATTPGPTPSCGDGAVNTASEDCDGTDLSGCPAGATSCDSSCHCLGCGDGTVIPPEECESGDLTRCPAGTTHCDASCMCATTPGGDVCGDGAVTGTEVCDPGSATLPAVTCESRGLVGPCVSCACTGTPPGGPDVCGDGARTGAEACDPGSATLPAVPCTDPTMVCDPVTCSCSTIPGGGTCGNNSVDAPGELCDESVVDPVFWSCPVAGSTCVGCTCIEPGATPACGNGTADTGEVCGEPTLAACPAGTRCQGCVCVPEIPPVTTGDPCLPCADGTVCECSGACAPEICTPPCSPCMMPSTDILEVKCDDRDEPPASVEKMKEMNRLAREAIGPGIGQSDLFCQPEATFKYWMNIGGGAWPSVSATQLAAGSINPALVGNIGNFAVVELKGQKIVDFTLNPMLPQKTNMIEKSTIILPVTNDVSKVFGKATTLPVDLSSATEVPFGLSLSNAEPIAPDIVTSYNVQQNNTFELNNVFKLTIAAAGETGKAAGEAGDAVVTAENKNDPLLCSWSANCPASEGVTDPAKSFDKVEFGKVLDILKEEGHKCQFGVCPPEVFERLHKDAGWPLYTIKTLAFVQGMPTESGAATTMPPKPPKVKIVTTAISPPMEAAAGGGCNCDITATRPDIASVIALIIITSIAAAGFVVVRVRKK